MPWSSTVNGGWKHAEKYGPKGFEFLTAPIPAPKGGRKNGSFCNGNFMIVPSSAHDPEGAWAFIKFWSGITDPQRAAEFYTWGGWLPLNREVAQAPIYRGYIKAHPQFETFVKLPGQPQCPARPARALSGLFFRQAGPS